VEVDPEAVVVAGGPHLPEEVVGMAAVAARPKLEEAVVVPDHLLVGTTTARRKRSSPGTSVRIAARRDIGPASAARRSATSRFMPPRQKLKAR